MGESTVVGGARTQGKGEILQLSHLREQGSFSTQNVGKGTFSPKGSNLGEASEMGTRRIVLSEQEKKRIELAVTAKALRIRHVYPYTRLRCKACNKRFHEESAKNNGHEGFCKKKCKLRAAKRTIRYQERTLSPDVKRKLRVERSVAQQSNTNFFTSREWQTLRFEAFLKFGRACMCCGSKPPQVVLHVDHIKPRYHYPDLALDINNLQILCEACNMGKGARYETDFREA